MLKQAAEDHLKIALDPELLGDRLDFDLIFGRSAPVHVEIGSGKGAFLLTQAQKERC